MGRQKLTYLSQEELERVCQQLLQENVVRDPQSPHGSRPWDSADGRRVTCLLCGIQLSCLGSRGKDHENHLLVRHGMSPEAYAAYSKAQGWGEAPTTSLYSRSQNSEHRKAHPDQVKAHNQEAEKRRAVRRKEDDAYGRRFFDKVRARRQKKLTDADKSDRVQCPLMNANGEPCEAWLLQLSTHLVSVHHMPTAVFRRLYPDIPLSVPSVVSDNRSRLESAREKQFGVPVERAQADVAAKQAELDAAKTRLAELKARQVGRPLTRRDDQAKYGPRIKELLGLGRSLGEITITMNSETGQNRTKSGWRKLITA